ncbi:MAG: transglutaminase-like cysteine peptidase [Pseudomonadales bacterium]|nr:transglutaminase-like cysteine peptidase [Pseudomonadales bacterium]
MNKLHLLLLLSSLYAFGSVTAEVGVALASNVAPVLSEEQVVSPKGWVELCHRNASSFVCSDALFKSLKSGYRYRSDIDGHGKVEYWVSQTDKYLLDGWFVGDCEDFALTLIDLALLYGLAKPEQIALVECINPGNTEYHHMVAAIGEIWFDPNQAELTRAETNACTPVKRMSLATHTWVKAKT